ncbi:hypothetical protein FKP32DRAFT_1605457 [Trametes sanguinea]|nr:hypothetical protein FKP32DRAFT_1605457 [Trametes sanguinea]
MKSFTALASAALLAVAVSAQQFTINTPTFSSSQPSSNPPTVCVPVQLTWSGGTPPYFLTIFPGGHPEEPALQQYPNLQGTSFTWSTNITAGTLVGFQLTDHNGQIAQSSSVQIMSGRSTADTSCLTGGSSSDTSSAGSSGTTSAATGTSTGTATAPAGSSTSSAGGSSGSSAGSGTSHAASGTSGSSSASPSATGGSSNSGFVNAASIGAVGVLSAVAALVLA